MTIKDVSQKFSLSQDTLRYYEKIGLIGPIRKNNSGIRDYDEEDLKRIEFVKCMRSADLPVYALVKYIKLYESGDETLEERRNLLVNQRESLRQKIVEMQEAYNKLNVKIDLYDKQMLDVNLKRNN